LCARLHCPARHGEFQAQAQHPLHQTPPWSKDKSNTVAGCSLPALPALCVVLFLETINIISLLDPCTHQTCVRSNPQSTTMQVPGTVTAVSAMFVVNKTRHPRLLRGKHPSLLISKNFCAGTCSFFQHALFIFNMPDFTSTCRFLSVAVSTCQIFFQICRIQQHHFSTCCFYTFNMPFFSAAISTCLIQELHFSTCLFSFLQHAVFYP
jgi:hypothetical protein